MRRLRRLSERAWRVLDAVLVVVLLVSAQVDLLTVDVEGPRAANILVLTAVALSFLWRRSRPLLTVLAVCTGLTLQAVFLTEPPEIFTAVLMLIAAAYAGGRHLQGRRSLAAIAVQTLTVLVVASVYDPNDVFFPVSIFCVVPWLVGRTLRNQTALARALSEKAERAAHERADEERRAIARERARIARELHDLLAHNLSVMVVQASAARRVLERDPDAASEAARLIVRTGREALDELRHLFGPVRRGEGEELSGMPGIKRLDELVRRARAAGLPVRLEVTGEPVPLPPGVDLTAYRVVQEALTNALKHAGEAHAKVAVSYEPGELVLSVEDDGSGPGRGAGDLDALSGGHGLVGMRERVAVYGGVLQAGRRRGGGFAVRVRLPIRPPVPTASERVPA